MSISLGFLKNDVEDVLFYCDDDKVLSDLCQEDSTCRLESYSVPNHCVEDGVTYLIDGESKHRLEIFGEHNLQNLNAALLVCQELGIQKSDFYKAISLFKGASKRLELVKKRGELSCL